jgi:hypothetical protein
MDDKKSKAELESLNIDDLDIEELERRLELASAIVASAEGCPNLQTCATYCGTDCYANSVISM